MKLFLNIERDYNRHFGKQYFTGNNLFSIIPEFRLQLEEKGYKLLCNVARIDAYPSRAILQMGGGRKIYLLELGKPAQKEKLVDIFAPAPIDKVGTVEEQRTNYKHWLESLK